MFIYENDKDVFMKNEKGLLLCLGAAALPPAGIAAYAHRLLKKRPLELLYQQRASESDFIPLSEIPDRMVQFILEAEDSDFYKHHGLNTEGIRDAIVINLNEKRVVSGGSTITQQLVKNLYFRFTKNYIRKATELLIVLQAEKQLGKDRILELYLNRCSCWPSCLTRRLKEIPFSIRMCLNGYATGGWFVLHRTPKRSLMKRKLRSFPHIMRICWIRT